MCEGAVTEMCGESHAAGAALEPAASASQKCAPRSTPTKREAQRTARGLRPSVLSRRRRHRRRPIVPPSPAPKCASGSYKLIMLGQSNMLLGMGRIGSATDDTNNSLYHAVTVEGKYPYLWDKAAKELDHLQEYAQRFCHGLRRYQHDPYTPTPG